ncbi:alginate export family protein [Mucilaginibacter sp. UR6-1]|uniref:alginate export family protein n=1 Tax=Mucilaginibacter sp. UR6-1 TaxID=1435643 RepID=UPI001E31D630|nr:alginate export family protein [Mucilaginibacter sp. UR6-1]MCC8409172.1 alginate export family protein [Mucilaginibacter sp. UR6-1]
MYKNVCKKYRFVVMGLCLGLLAGRANAQLTFSGQLRPRAEWRDGFGTLKPKNNTAAAFISQRTRLALNYRSNRLIFQTTLQDVRLWGQDASTITVNDGSRLSLHEAWAEVILSNKSDTSFKYSPLDYFAIKIGRQELVYDDERLLGNLDWLQQGRRHDALVFKTLHRGWQADVGVAFNQNTDAVNYNGTYYTPANVPATIKDSNGNLVNTPAGIIPLISAAGNSAKNGTPAILNAPGTNGATQNYKALQYLYLSKKINKTKISALFLTDQFGKYALDSVKNTAGADVGYVYGYRYNQPGVNLRYTTGLSLTPVLGNKSQWVFNGAYYYQGGHDRSGIDLSAYMLNVSAIYNPGKWSYTAGWDYLSGNDAFSTSTTSHRFDPLYGTPHKFWGLMDYFYAGSGSPAGGLNNPFGKIKYVSSGKKFSAELANHYFLLANNQKDNTGAAVSKYLGTEFDVTTAYRLNKFTQATLGISYMAATHSMEYAKNIAPGTADMHPVWAYLQLNITPEFLIK